MGTLHREWDDFLKEPRIRVLAPRDHLKTFYWSICYPILRAMVQGDIEIYIFSHTEKQAKKILAQIKKIVKNTPSLKWLSEGSDVDFWTKTEICFSNGTIIYAQGYGTSVRGGHPKVIILDDVIDQDVIYSDEQNTKSKEKFFGDILPMAEPDTQIIFVGTLQREDDLYNSLDPKIYKLKTYDAIVDEEKKISLFPEKWSWEKLMRRKDEICFSFGERFFMKEYRNMALQLAGEIIKPEWIKYYDKIENLPEGDDYVGFDLSVGKHPEKGDYTGCVVFRITENKNIYLLYVNRWRIDFTERLKKIVETARVWELKKIRIEDNTFQADTVQTLKRNTALPIEGVSTTKNKVQKFTEDLAPLFENGKIYLLRGDKMQEKFRREILALPRGKHDDMADALCIGLKGLLLEASPRIRLL